MVGKRGSPPKTNKDIFYLDECLPYQIADALHKVGYPITSWEEEFHRQGVLDPELAPYLASHNLVWITKDDAARSEHKSDIEKYQISVAWIRGIQRQKGKLQEQQIKPKMKDVHRMLVNKLDEIAEQVAKAKGPRYFILFLKGAKTMLSPFPTLKDVTEYLENKPGQFSNIPSKV